MTLGFRTILKTIQGDRMLRNFKPIALLTTLHVLRLFKAKSVSILVSSRNLKI